MKLCYEKISYSYPHLSATAPLPAALTSVLLYQGVCLFLFPIFSSKSPTPPLHASFSAWASFFLALLSHFGNMSCSIWSIFSHSCQYFFSLSHPSDQPLPAAIPLQLLPHTQVHSSTFAQTEKASAACIPSHPD